VAAVVNDFALQKGLLVHEEGHPARDLMARKPSNLNRLLALTRSPEILCSKMGPAADSLPQWNKVEFEVHSLLSRAWMMHFAPINARIVLTLSCAPSKLHIPLPI
jgi:hypothetical protein